MLKYLGKRKVGRGREKEKGKRGEKRVLHLSLTGGGLGWAVFSQSQFKAQCARASQLPPFVLQSSNSPSLALRVQAAPRLRLDLDLDQTSTSCPLPTLSWTDIDTTNSQTDCYYYQSLPARSSAILFFFCHWRLFVDICSCLAAPCLVSLSLAFIATH